MEPTKPLVTSLTGERTFSALEAEQVMLFLIRMIILMDEPQALRKISLELRRFSASWPLLQLGLRRRALYAGRQQQGRWMIFWDLKEHVFPMAQLHLDEAR